MRERTPLIGGPPVATVTLARLVSSDPSELSPLLLLPVATAASVEKFSVCVEILDTVEPLSLSLYETLLN